MATAIRSIEKQINSLPMVTFPKIASLVLEVRSTLRISGAFDDVDVKIASIAGASSDCPALPGLISFSNADRFNT